ncbi:ClpXP protease specificity-enhancing factor [Iodobacter arcticus]|uniref:ClpXP protease specificity-enhancing factor n=1 Tax=Iodobacter arcticus TaxID=590593 RepID=A0ABW2R045_9NEIS|nr:ClpXP protease specificity-enhancing factor [Janthinobacterium sp. B9-8]AMC36454.1 stringent starvation protein B [Janthinobacterium sp. B9-8]
MQTVSTKPYLIRALHEWCSDHSYTPYLVVRVMGKMQVPMEHVKNNEIVLDISYNATHNLSIGNDYISFSARFSGVSREILVPIGCVVSIFSRENGEGMGFEYEGPSETTETPDNGPDDTPPRPSGKPQLRIVK